MSQGIYMKFWLQKSTMVIFSFTLVMGVICLVALNSADQEGWGEDAAGALKEVPSRMEQIDYFNLKDNKPLISLAANSMESFGEDYVNFVNPKGEYITPQDQKPIHYQAQRAEYEKKSDRLNLNRLVTLTKEESRYSGDSLTYWLKKDLLVGKGDVEVFSVDKKKGQQVQMRADRMKAYPGKKMSSFYPLAKGEVVDLKRHTPKIFLTAGLVDMDGIKQLIMLKNGVQFDRGDMSLSARKGDIFLENQNKRLKYLVFNDDVKLKEKLKLKSGEEVIRKGFSERLEGFGLDESFVLSGAPRVEQGADVIKGYKITLREKMEFIEVDDAMSDIETKQEKDKK
jgi:lipopolysaccharide export system protein LptA